MGTRVVVGEVLCLLPWWATERVDGTCLTPLGNRDETVCVWWRVVCRVLSVGEEGHDVICVSVPGGMW